jgi:hypothetical protein
LYVPEDELISAITTLSTHGKQNRVAEKDHWLRNLKVALPELPPLQPVDPGAQASPMAEIDKWFCQLVEQNPMHRVRVGLNNRPEKDLSLQGIVTISSGVKQYL